jgi:protein O-GlcNAc transferase
MGLMALRSAPIQILHQEFLMTSGAQYFDYIVTDMVTSPPRLEKLYTEKFLYLPNHFFSKGHAVQREVKPPKLEYVPRKNGSTSFEIGVGSPQDNACQSTNPLGGVNNNQVSFVYCNFNKFLKHNPMTMRSWIRILRDVPNSILCLLEYPTEGVANLRQFVTHESTHAVDGENNGSTLRGDKTDVNDRIHFIKWEWNPFDHQQRTYSLCNAMLDSHPYNGHTTAQDAYFAGVPIVTRSDGDEMSSRVTTSANIVLGLDELNAYDGAREYERIAVRLGKDEAWFASLRARLVESCLWKNQMHKYWDVPRYVRNFERGLKTAWENYLDGKEIDHVIVREDGDEKLLGTTWDELLAREARRNNRERHHIHNEL